MPIDKPKAKRSYGSGSLTQRDGRWYGAWRIHGTQKSRVVGKVRTRGEADGLTKAEAEARLRQMMRESEEQAPNRTLSNRRATAMTMAMLGERYIEHAREHRGLKEATTLTDYESHLRVHIAPFFMDTPIRKIEADMIEKFAKHLRMKKGQGRRGGKPLSPKSVKNYLGTVSTLLNFAVRKKWIADSPFRAVDLPTGKADAPLDELTFLEPDEVARLVATAVAGGYQVLDRALYILAAYTGLRQGELRGLRWVNVDFDSPVVHVLEGVTRGKRSSPKGKRRRAVPLAPTAAQALRDLKAVSAWTADDDPVFATPLTGNPMARAGIMERYREALVAAGLSAEFSFHDLRHTFGTTLARAGKDVGTIQAWMGHADLATTQLYMHYAPRVDDAASIDAAFAPVGVTP